MATTPHANLTGSDLHEPKGVATATNKQIYVANGVASGAWTNWPTGWAYYKDSKTGGPVQTITTTASILENDGAGSSTEESYLPIAIRGSASLWDTTNDRITPVAVGDSYTCRLDARIAAKSGSPTELTITLDIGGTSSITVPIMERYVGLSKTPPYTISVGFSIYCLSTFFSNGGALFLETDTGSIDVDEAGILLSRIHAGPDY